MADISKIELLNNVYDIKDATARNDIATLTSSMAEKISNADGRTTENFKIYLNADTGSDDNDGRTNANAIKTLDAVFTKYGNKGNTNLWLFFNPGDYELNAQNLNNMAIHWGIKSSTNGNVTISFKNTMYAIDSSNVDIAFYSCHCHFTGNYSGNNQKIILKGTQTCRRIYFDSGGLATDDGVEFQDLALAFHQSGLEARRTTIPQLEVSDSEARIETSSSVGSIQGYCSKIMTGNNTTYLNNTVYDTNTTLIRLWQTDLMLSGATYINMQESPSKTNFIEMYGGELVMLAAFNKNGSETFTGFSKLHGVTIKATQGRYNTLKALATTNTFDADCIYSSSITTQ